MTYGQKNSLATQGINGKYRVDQIGCFLTSDANLIDRLNGSGPDPVTLNNFYADHGVYIDVDDGVRDDLSYYSVTAYDPTITVKNRGTTGWPSSNDSIVCFRYRSLHTGEMINHFCLVADAANHVIIDSWDGLTKSPDQYQNVYGSPVAWAEFVKSTPPSVQPTTTDNHPSTGYSGGKKLFLPAAAGTWRVYSLDKTPVVGNEVGKLAPGRPDFAPGLIYDILGTTQWANVFTIHTQTWGNVNIYAGPDTIAQFVDQAPVAPAPTPPPAPAPDPTPETLPSPPVPAPVEPTPPAVPDAGAGDQIPVTVIPADPNKWKQTWTRGLGVVVYRASKNVAVQDAEGLHPDLQLLEGQIVKIAGTFDVDGVEYYRTATSVENDTWYKIPTDAVTRGVSTNNDNDISDILDIHDLVKTPKDKLVAEAAKIAGGGFFPWLFRTLHFKK